MNTEEMKLRTKEFAIKIAQRTLRLPDNSINRVYKGQILRSSSSSGANYGASVRAKSEANFINKRKIVEEELDETLFFLELLESFNEPFKGEIRELYNEGEILLKISVASIISSR